MKFDLTYLTLKTDKKLSCGVNKVRGYIGNTFNEHPILHNHYSSDKYLFSYPLVQYKIINGNVLILGIDEGSDLIKKIHPQLSSLSLDRKYQVVEKYVVEKKVDIKPSSEEKHYRFVTPWLGLNTKNYPKYNALKTWKEKKDLINKILVGNLLSMSKGLGIIVNKKLYAKTHFDSKQVQYKSVYMTSFTGEFKIHYDIPDYFGLGKGVSHGFGCVKQITDE